MAVGHVGSNEAVAAAIAHHGMPISVVADDSSFPEIFEILRRQREAWGVKIIAVAQPARDLRRAPAARDARIARRLGLPLRRDPRAPLRRVDGAAGRPRDARREDRVADPADHHPPPARRHVPRLVAGPIEVASSDPAELQRATQAIADALASTIAAAPDQWYSFKPIWPATAEEAADLERRAALMQAGTSPTRVLARGVRADEPGAAADGASGEPARRRGLRRRRGWPAGCPSGRWSRWPNWPATSGTGRTPERAAQARRNLLGSRQWLAAHERGTPLARAAAHDPRALERLVRLAYRHAARYYLEVARTPGDAAPATSTSGSRSRRRRSSSEAFTLGRPVDLRRPALRRDRAAGPAAWRRASASAVAPMETLDDPELQAWFVRSRGAVGIRIVGRAGGPPRAHGRPARRGAASASSAIAT